MSVRQTLFRAQLIDQYFHWVQYSHFQENEQCVRALLDADKTQWRELVGIISKGKNDEAEMAADQMRKLFIDQSVPREKLCTLFVEYIMA